MGLRARLFGSRIIRVHSPAPPWPSARAERLKPRLGNGKPAYAGSIRGMYRFAGPAVARASRKVSRRIHPLAERVYSDSQPLLQRDFRLPPEERLRLRY